MLSSCVVSGSATMLRNGRRHRQLFWHTRLYSLRLHPQRLVTSRPSLLDVSAQMPGVGIPPSDSLPYSHSHSLVSVAEMVATAASPTVSSVVGIIGTGTGLSVQSAAMKV